MEHPGIRQFESLSVTFGSESKASTGLPDLKMRRVFYVKPNLCEIELDQIKSAPL